MSRRPIDSSYYFISRLNILGLKIQIPTSSKLTFRAEETYNDLKHKCPYPTINHRHDLWISGRWEWGTKRVGSTEWQPLGSIAVQITERELIGVGVAYHERGQ